MFNTTERLITILMIIGMIFIGLIIWDKKAAQRQSIEDRIEWLEEKMIERVKPIIQVNRATIYNTDGEIVLETLREKK